MVLRRVGAEVERWDLPRNHEPLALSPDGSRLLVVTNRAQNNNLEVITVDRRREALTEVTDHTQFATPRYSPDGRVVAVSVWKAGRRDLWLVRHGDARGSAVHLRLSREAHRAAPRDIGGRPTFLRSFARNTKFKSKAHGNGYTHNRYRGGPEGPRHC